jgi:hypothetical protein
VSADIILGVTTSLSASLYDWMPSTRRHCAATEKARRASHVLLQVTWFSTSGGRASPDLATLIRRSHQPDPWPGQGWVTSFLYACAVRSVQDRTQDRNNNPTHS